MTQFRSLLFNTLLIVWTFGFGLLALPLLILVRKSASPVADLWTAGILAMARGICGIRHEVTGGENRPHAAIYAAKHQSAWETIALWRLLDRPVFILKKELLTIPVFGTYLRCVPHIAIDRSAGSSAIKEMVAQGRAHLAAGRRIVIFPEGTRTRPGERVPYKNGIATLYRQLGVPVVPVALNAGLIWGRRAWTKRPGTIRIVFLPPLEPGIPKDEFMTRLEAAIEETSLALLSRFPP